MTDAVYAGLAPSLNYTLVFALQLRKIRTSGGKGWAQFVASTWQPFLRSGLDWPANFTSR
jgi:hypothetical protein